MSRDLDFEAEQRVRDILAERALRYAPQAYDHYCRMFLHAIGKQHLEDMKPAERKLVYATAPPILMDGTIPGPQADGSYDWAGMARTSPEQHKAYVNDYAHLVQGAMQGQGGSIESQVEQGIQKRVVGEIVNAASPVGVR